MPRPDEGLIHSWLDGQLPPDEAARVEQLVATDAEWAAAAAEARGVIAATSRILSALDQVPAGVVPKGTATPVSRRAVRRLPWWTKMAAAVVLVAGASTLVMRQTPAPKMARNPQAADVAGAAEMRAMPSAPVAVATPPSAPAPAVRAETARPEAPPQVTARSVDKATAVATVPAAAAAALSAVVPSVAASASAPAPTQQVGGVSAPQAKVEMAADRELRMQPLDQTRQGAAPVMAQRTSGTARPEMTQDAPPMEAVRNLTAPAPIAMRARLTPGGCHALRGSGTSAAGGAVMRGDRMQGDTLFLVPAGAPSPARAWLVAGNGVVRGVLTLEAEGRGMVLVTAVPVACPVP